MSDLSKITLAMLAGGRGSRMGQPKAMLRIEDQPILQWQFNRLRWPGPTMLVTTPALANLPGAECFDQIAVDPQDDLGPVRGILTALQHPHTQTLAIIPVDMPKVTTQQLRWMTEACTGDVLGVMCRPVGSTWVQPLPLVVHRSALAAVQRVMDLPRRAIGELARQDGFVTLDAPADWPVDTWMNLNDPQALQLFVADLKEEK